MTGGGQPGRGRGVGRTAGHRQADAEHREHIGLALAPHLVAATLLQFAATPSALLAVDHY